jgi:hypothetical protein
MECYIYRYIYIYNRKATWKEDISHTGGYTDARVVVTVTDCSIVYIWIGWKVVEGVNVHNIYYNSIVQMESYMDEKNDNKWKGVNQLIDSND